MPATNMNPRRKAANDDIFNIEDIRSEILSRLPFKSVLRCRTINKSWRTTIDSSSFRNLHVKNRLFKNSFDDDEESNFLGFVYSYSVRSCIFLPPVVMLVDTGEYYDFPSYQDFFRTNVGILRNSRPVHGLICLYEGNSTYPIALYNPSLREIKILPPSPHPRPSKATRTVGLGYDEITRDYKAVQLLHDWSRGSTVVEVYSRKENTWRVLPDHPLHEGYLVTANEAQHVQQLSGKTSSKIYWQGVYRSNRVIVSFDTCREVFQTIEIPVINKYTLTDIFAKEDSIIMFVGCLVGSEGLIIWEYKRNWVKVGYLPPFQASVHPEAFVRPVATCKSNGFILRVQASDHKFEFYDYEQSSRKITKIFDELPVDDWNMIEYEGSFISP